MIRQAYGDRKRSMLRGDWSEISASVATVPCYHSKVTRRYAPIVITKLTIVGLVTCQINYKRLIDACKTNIKIKVSSIGAAD